MAVATHPEFALETLEVSDDQVVVQGRWFGVTGRRFVRPAIRIDGQRRVIATLEHKPWAAIEGDLWVAAFPYSGDAIESATLEVAPDVNVDLTTGKPVVPLAPDKQKASEAKPARRRATTKPNRDDLVEARHKAEREREDLRSQLDHARSLREEAFEERDAAIAARDAALKEAADRERRVLERAGAAVDRARAEFEAAREKYDDTYLRAVRAEQAADDARAELAAAEEQRSQAVQVDTITESARLLGERDAARTEAQRLRDEVEHARDATHAERGAVGADRERLREERNAARAEAERLRRELERARGESVELERVRDAARAEADQLRRQQTPTRVQAAPPRHLDSLPETQEHAAPRPAAEPTVELPPDRASRAPGLAPRLRSRLDLPTDPEEDSDLGVRLVAAALIVLMVVAFVVVLGMIF